MVLTERDMKLLEMLQYHGIMTTRQISETVFICSGRPTILRRLRILHKNRYIQRLDGLKEYATGWALTRKSARLFFQKEICKTRFPRHQRDHEVYLTKVRLHSGLFTAWVPEHVIRSSMAKEHGLRGLQKRVVPDGIATVLVDNVQEAVAIELELHAKNSKRYRQSFRGYAAKRNVWAVWYLVANDAIGKKLERIWKQLSYEHAGRPYFFWMNLYNFLEGHKWTKMHSVQGEQFLGKLCSPNDPYYSAERAPGVSTYWDSQDPYNDDLSTENETKKLSSTG